GDFVRVDKGTSEFDEHLADGCLSGGDSSGQTHSQHQIPRRMRAALTVFFISVAIVIGPTPPGTGVNIDATSFTDRSSTSPAQMYPRLSKSFHRDGSSPNRRRTSSLLATLFVPTSIT